MKPLCQIGGAALIAWCAACSGSTDVTHPKQPVPAQVIAVSGTPQQVNVGGTAAALVARVTDADNLPVQGVTVTFAVTSGSGTVSPASAVTDTGGRASTVFTAGNAPESDQVLATVQGTSLQATFTISVVKPVAAAASCDTVSAPILLSVGQVLTGVPSGACISGDAIGAEYTLIPFHASTVPGATVSLDVVGHGIGTPVSADTTSPTPIRMPISASLGVRGGTTLTRDLAFEQALRLRERRELLARAASARAWYHTMRAGVSGGALANAIPATVQVGTLVTLNSNANQACSNPKPTVGRVAAVSQTAIVVADTSNPPGGFTDAEYAAFATTFDTLINPLDTQAFGTPSDIDHNGRVIIFFTKAVNALTPKNSQSYVGGFFFGRDLLPSSGTNGCAGSNVAEMFYLLVPDTAGVVNGNVRTKTMVQNVTEGTLAHEYQHLINASRRMYVNNAAEVAEETWLNEGLSHIAEELLFYRVSGLAPRQNLDLAKLRASQRYVDAFNLYEISNFRRYQTYLPAPSKNTPYAADDSLPTRGAIWSFLRYAADHQGSSDGTVWYQLVNSQTTGIANLQGVFGSDVLGLFRDWAASVYTDDLIPGVDARYQQPSWNFRSILPVIGGFNLNVIDLTNDTTKSISLVGGGVAFLHFEVPAGQKALLTTTSAGATPPPAVVLMLVRTR